MNWLDIVLAALVVAGFIKGYRDGFIRQVVFFFAWIAAIYLCSKVAINLRSYVISIDLFPENSVTVVSFILAFVIIAGVIILAGWIVHKMISATPLSLLNHIAGALLGCIVTLLLISLALNVMKGLDSRSAFISQETKEDSRFYYYCVELIPAIYPLDFFIGKGEIEE